MGVRELIAFVIFLTHRIPMHMIGFTSALFNLGRHGSLQLFIRSLLRVLALSYLLIRTMKKRIDH